MTTKKEFLEKYKKYNVDFFNKNFVGKNINLAILDRIDKCVLCLCSVYMQFVFLENALTYLKNNKKCRSKLDKDTKKNIKFALKAVEIICNKLEKIIDPICDGMK